MNSCISVNSSLNEMHDSLLERTCQGVHFISQNLMGTDSHSGSRSRFVSIFSLPCNWVISSLSKDCSTSMESSDEGHQLFVQIVGVHCVCEDVMTKNNKNYCSICILIDFSHSK